MWGPQHFRYQSPVESRTGLTAPLRAHGIRSPEPAKGRIWWFGATRAEARNFALKMCNLSVTHIATLKVHICAAGYPAQSKWDRRAKPSKCVCALCSTTALHMKRRPEPHRSSTALRASESAVFDRNKSRTLADKVSFTLPAHNDEGKCCRMLPCAAK